MIQLPLYTRRNSSDNIDVQEPLCSDKTKKIANKTIYYSLLGGCILAFQYLFFQYVVLAYDPLSTAEVEYIMYERASDEFDLTDDLTTH